jgi:NADPH-dependent curcumin reductase CurA
VDGFENTPNAFIQLLNGKNIGKMVVRLVAAAAAAPSTN